MTKIKTRLGQMAVATMLATGLLVVAHIDSADATFPGKNGVIAFESNRTTGKDVHNPTGDTEIFTIRPDGGGLEQLTHNKAEDFSPAFSPNGHQIAFVSERDGDFEVYKMGADGSHERNLTRNPANDFHPAFSPDGRRIAFTTSRKGDFFEIFAMNADGSSPRNLTRNQVDDSDPDFSPDGRHLAFTTSRDDNEEI
jgi:Tol biopolymer transport system component